MTEAKEIPRKQNNEKSDAATDNKPRKPSAMWETLSEVNHSIHGHVSQFFSLSSRFSF
jgi:hypothetical protein